MLTNQLNNLRNVDPKVLEWLVNMHNTLSKDKIDLKDISSLYDILSHLNDDAKKDYINCLLYPEMSAGCKVPTLFPIPSASFQMHFLYTGLTTNASGNFAWTWNPYFLQDAGAAAQASSFFVDTNAALTGTASDANFAAVQIGYNQIPAGVYGSYRVVSAAVVVSYVGRMDIVSGSLGMGVGLNNAGVGTPQTGVVVDTNSSTFGNFAQVDNLYYKQRTPTANGMRGIYFPIDTRFTEFLPLNTAAGPGATLANTYYTGFYFAGYGQGLPASTAGMIRFDLYVNYECEVVPGFNNFIPSSPGNSSNVSAIQTAGDLITKTPSLVIKDGSDIPGLPDNTVSSVSILNNLASGDQPSLLPNIEVIRKFIKY